MTILMLLGLSALFLAYSNGANDNFKGIATVYGSNILSYRDALALATVATFVGGASAVLLASSLVKVFSGAGVVPAVVAASPVFLGAVATGAAVTVAVATRLGLPVSTTHAMTGAIVGAGFLAAHAQLNIGVLGKSFFAPLLISPLLAILLSMPLYQVLHRTRRWMGLSKESCVCVGTAKFVPVHTVQVTPDVATYGLAWSSEVSGVIVVGSERDCVEKFRGRVHGIAVQRVIDLTHCISAAVVSFARGLNDTPKIVAMLLAIRALDLRLGGAGIALAMAIGGLISARKVAQTMSKKISRMNDGQALTANMVTAFLVIIASRFGVPVSTTHVSVGAIAGIGLANRTANAGVISTILASWLLTLPMAAAFGAATYLALRFAT